MSERSRFKTGYRLMRAWQRGNRRGAIAAAEAGKGSAYAARGSLRLRMALEVAERAAEPRVAFRDELGLPVYRGLDVTKPTRAVLDPIERDRRAQAGTSYDPLLRGDPT